MCAAPLNEAPVALSGQWPGSRRKGQARAPIERAPGRPLRADAAGVGRVFSLESIIVTHQDRHDWFLCELCFFFWERVMVRWWPAAGYRPQKSPHRAKDEQPVLRSMLAPAGMPVGLRRITER